MYEMRYNICTANHYSSYSDDIEDIKRTARENGVRFITTGYADVEEREGGTLYTRRTDGGVDLFDTFVDKNRTMCAPDKGTDFAGFLPVTYDELRIALDALKAFREPAPMVPHAEYGHLHPKVQALYRGVFNPEAGHQDFYLRDPDEVAA